MFDLTSYWFWIFAGLVASTATVSRYKTRNLPPKQKELAELFYRFGIFQIIFWYSTFYMFGFNSPFLGDFTTVPENINNLEEARKVLQDQSRSLGELRKNLIEFKGIISFLLVAFIYLILPSIYNFARAITPNDNEKILDLNVAERKSVFGLNDE